MSHTKLYIINCEAEFWITIFLAPWISHNLDQSIELANTQTNPKNILLSEWLKTGCQRLCLSRRISRLHSKRQHNCCECELQTCMWMRAWSVGLTYSRTNTAELIESQTSGCAACAETASLPSPLTHTTSSFLYSFLKRNIPTQRKLAFTFGDHNKQM